MESKRRTYKSRVLRIEIERAALRELRRLPANVGDLIEEKIEQLASDPNVLRNNVKRLAGTKQSRLRVGDWSVVFRIDGNTLRIIRVASRGSVYE